MANVATRMRNSDEISTKFRQDSRPCAASIPFYGASSIIKRFPSGGHALAACDVKRCRPAYLEGVAECVEEEEVGGGRPPQLPRLAGPLPFLGRLWVRARVLSYLRRIRRLRADTLFTLLCLHGS